MSKRIEKCPIDEEKIHVHAKRRSRINAMGMTKSTSMAVGVIYVREDGRSNTNIKGNTWNTKEFSQGADGS